MPSRRPPTSPGPSAPDPRRHHLLELPASGPWCLPSPAQRTRPPASTWLAPSPCPVRAHGAHVPGEKQAAREAAVALPDALSPRRKDVPSWKWEVSVWWATEGDQGWDGKRWFGFFQRLSLGRSLHFAGRGESRAARVREGEDGKARVLTSDDTLTTVRLTDAWQVAEPLETSSERLSEKERTGGREERKASRQFVQAESGLISWLLPPSRHLWS